jgi:hypothetical protein
MGIDVDKGGPKDAWDKTAIILSPLGGLLTGLAVAGLGFFVSRSLSLQQGRASDSQLYSQLLSTREQSEASLRKDMFQSIITSFLADQSSPAKGGVPPVSEASLEAEVLKLELLAENFHESLNLAPLFYHVRRDVDGSSLPTAAKTELDVRLIALGRHVSQHQTDALMYGGVRWDLEFPLDTVPSPMLDTVLTMDSVTRSFSMLVDSVDMRAGSVWVELVTKVVSKPGRTAPEDLKGATFEVGAFDAPMIDNLHLSNDQRVAVVLDQINTLAPPRPGRGASSAEALRGATAHVVLLYFPGALASVREKPYIEDVLRRLGDSTAAPSASPRP